MAISIGTITNSGNRTNSTGFDLSHVCTANTKTIIAIVTGYDSSSSDSTVSNIVASYGPTYGFQPVSGSYATNQYRVGSAFTEIFFVEGSFGGISFTISLSMTGTCTDLQLTVMDLVSTQDRVRLDTYANATSSTTTQSVLINPSANNAFAVGGIVHLGSTIATLSVTSGYGTEITGSEADMGSQVVGCAYRQCSGTTAEIRWTKTAAVVSSASIATFYEYTELLSTTSLNSPSHLSTLATQTPSFTFTGTDGNLNDLDYEIQVDSSSSFNSSVSTLIQSYPISNANTTNYLRSDTGGTKSYGQSYTSNGQTIGIVSWYVGKLGSPSGTLTAKVYTSVINTDTDIRPSSELGASTPIDISTLNSSMTLVSFTFPTPIPQTSSEIYVITIQLSNGGSDASNGILVGMDSDSPSDPGFPSYQDANLNLWWPGNNSDFVYEIKTPEGQPIIYAKSTDHTGFSAGANHPTPSGQQQTYTSQISLPSGTYYWRVRSIDRLGSNSWSQWSAGDTGLGYNTFTISLGPSTITVNVWNGSSWIPAILKYWNGSTWATETPKIWNGSSWT